uniref:RRM domain-containing protein n=1 Tax=Mesocestoides corti TaxID=53468 RepID=A0A5K3FH36_MESCO
MVKKSRKFRNICAVASDAEVGVAVGKAETRDRSISLVAPSTSVCSRKGKKWNRGNRKGCDLDASPEPLPGKADMQQREIGKSKRKRKRGKQSNEVVGQKVIPTIQDSPTKANALSNAPCKAGGGSHSRKRKSAASISGNESAKKRKMAKPVEAASSDSEPELIHADWELADDSSVEENFGTEKNDGNESDEEDLDSSEEDIDEEVPDLSNVSSSSSSSDDGDESNDSEVEEEPINDISATELKKVAGNSTSEELEKKNKESKNLGNRGKAIKFSLSDKAAIFREMEKRAAELNSRCLYLAPIPSNCTFDMLKKFIPTMTTCRFFTKPKSAKLRTYAFVEFVDAETAAKEKVSISGRLFAGQSVRAELRSCQHAQSDGGKTVEDIDFLRITVSGLSPLVNLVDLQTLFSTADSIRMPTASNKCNYGSATLYYVSDAVALDAFSQCHNFVLKGNPICVNFAFKQSAKKHSSIATATLSETFTPDPVARVQTEPPPSQRIGKVLIQPMPDSEDEGPEKSMDNFTKNTKRERPRSQKQVEKSSENEQPSNKGKLVPCNKVVKKPIKEEVATNGIASSSCILSEMMKKAKQDVEKSEEDKQSNESKNETSGEESSEDDVNEDDGDEEDLDGSDDDSDPSSSECESTGNDGSAKKDDTTSVLKDVEHEGDSGDEIDASLLAALRARRACAKALKAPGAKRNWRAGNSSRKRLGGTVPRMLPVPKKRRKEAFDV